MPKHTKQAEVGSGTTALAEPTEERLYWCGALPAIGEFEITVPTLAKTSFYNVSTQEYAEQVKATAFNLWFKHNPRMWIGKCPYYQNIGIRGWEFVAFTERKIDQMMTEGENAMEPWPGNVAKFSPEQAKEIIAAARNHVMREEKGKGAKPQRYENVSFVNLAEELPKDRDLSNPLERAVMWKKPAWNARTDTRVSELVYIVPLDADPSMDPKDYHLNVPPMNEFLVKPPQSVAEMWAEKKEAVA